MTTDVSISAKHLEQHLPFLLSKPAEDSGEDNSLVVLIDPKTLLDASALDIVRAGATPRLDLGLLARLLGVNQFVDFDNREAGTLGGAVGEDHCRAFRLADISIIAGGSDSGSPTITQMA